MEKQGRERQEDWELKEVEVKTRGLGVKTRGTGRKTRGMEVRGRSQMNTIKKYSLFHSVPSALQHTSPSVHVGLWSPFHDRDEMSVRSLESHQIPFQAPWGISVCKDI